MRALIIPALIALAGCATTDSGFMPIGDVQQARPTDHKIEIFRSGDVPDRKFEEVAVLDVHLETLGFVKREFKEAQSELEEQARKAGGDAIIDIKENSTRYLENTIYHVTAKAIRYTD